MTDIMTIVFDGRLHQAIGGRLYRRPSFLMPDPYLSPEPYLPPGAVLTTRPRLSLATDAAGSGRPAAAAPTSSLRFQRKRNRSSVLPKFLVTFARWVNPF